MKKVDKNKAPIARRTLTDLRENHPRVLLLGAMGMLAAKRFPWWLTLDRGQFGSCGLSERLVPRWRLRDLAAELRAEEDEEKEDEDKTESEDGGDELDDDGVIEDVPVIEEDEWDEDDFDDDFDDDFEEELEDDEDESDDDEAEEDEDFKDGEI